MIYYIMEGIWRIHSNGGWAHISMALVGGVCFMFIGMLNQMPEFYIQRMVVQSFFGALLILAVELFSGAILNIGLGLQIWDYSDVPLNIGGQICLPMAIVWLFIMPFAIWLEDRATFLYYLYQKAMGRSQVNHYKNGHIQRQFHSQTINDDVYIYSLFDAYKSFFCLT